MIFCQNEQKKEKLIEKCSNVAFFTFSGGAIGTVIGGSFGLFKGIPLKKILPRTIFLNSAFFASISAIQNALELVRNEKDVWNPLIAGGWTGFIFGHGIMRNFKIGLGLGLNAALINLAVQSFTLPRSFNHFHSTLNLLNPILLESQSAPLKTRIDALKSEINSLKKN